MTGLAWSALVSATGAPDGPEAALVARVLGGDRDAFGELVARHHRAVWAIAYRMTGRAADADELSQEVFLRVYRALPRFDRARPLLPWLRTLACHVVLNHVRAARRRGTAVPIPDEDEDAAAGLRDPRAGPEEALVARSRSARLVRALATLPEDQRLVLTLKYVEGLTSGEIAEALGRSRDTVKTWLLRGRERLRRELTDAP